MSFLDTLLLKNFQVSIFLVSFLFLSIYLSMQFLDIKFQNQAQYINVVKVLGWKVGGSGGGGGKERRPPPICLLHILDTGLN